MSKEDHGADNHLEGCECGCGEVGAQGHEPRTCTGSLTIPTLEEQYILGQIRSAQEDARRIKETLAQLETQANPPESSIGDLRDQLRVLRQRRADLEAQRVRAAHERMRLLGHV
jgi:hypothetical protein